MEIETLDKTSELAKKTMAKFEADDKVKADEATKKAEEESKGASSGESSTEKEKTEGSEEDKAGKADEGNLNDVQILESDDKDLGDENIARKQELIKAKEEARTPEEKQKDWQDSVNKRIGGINDELKAEKEGRVADAGTIKELEAKIANLKGDLESAGSIESDADRITKSEEEIYAKMITEDKDLPREKRREMSEEDLEEFLLEDNAKAQRWLARNEHRRATDRTNRVKARDAVDDIAKSAKQFFDKYPACHTEEQHKKLVATGMTDAEAMDTIAKEVPDYKMMMEIIKSDKKYVDPKTGPGELMAEMDRRNKEDPKENPKGGKMVTVEEAQRLADEAVERENARRDSLDVGITSSSDGAAPTMDSSDPMYKAKWKEWVKASKRPSAYGQDWSEAEFRKTISYGDKIRRANPR